MAAQCDFEGHTWKTCWKMEKLRNVYIIDYIWVRNWVFGWIFLCWISVFNLLLFLLFSECSVESPFWSCFYFVSVLFFWFVFYFQLFFFWTVFFIPEVGVLWVIIFHTRNYNNLQSCISHYITIPIDSAKSGRKMTFQKILTFTVELWIYWRLPLWIIAIRCLRSLSAPLQDLDWDASAREKGAWTAGSWRLTC